MKNVKTFLDFLNENRSSGINDESLQMIPLVEAIQSIEFGDLIKEDWESKELPDFNTTDDFSDIASKKDKKGRTGEFKYGPYTESDVKRIMDSAWASCGGKQVEIKTPTGRDKMGYPVTPELGKVMAAVAKTVVNVKASGGYFGTTDKRHWSKIESEKNDAISKAIEEMIGDWGKYYNSEAIRKNPNAKNGPGLWLWGLSTKSLGTDKKAKIVKAGQEDVYKDEKYDELSRKEMMGGSSSDTDQRSVAKEVISILKKSKKMTYEDIKRAIETEHRSIGELDFDFEDYINRKTVEKIREML